MGKNLTSALYSETKNLNFFLMKQRLQKKQKQQNKQMVLEFMHALNVEILSSFNPELHLKNTEASIKNELKDLLNELRVFKYFITLVEKLKKQ